MALIILGVFMAVCIWIFQTRKIGLKAKIISLAVLGLSFVGFVALFRQGAFLGSTIWYNRSPYKEICFLLFMLLGMVVRYFAFAIEQRRDKIAELRKTGQADPRIGLQFDAWEFSYPLLFSVVTFGGLLGQVKDGDLTVANVMLSFQSGFFWQTLLKKSAPTG